MDLINKNDNFYHRKKNNKMRNKLLISGAFLFVIMLILFTSFYSDFSLTGSVVNTYSSITGKTHELVNTNNSIYVSGEIGVPELKISTKKNSIDISGVTGNFVIDKKNIEMQDIDNQISLEDFEGEIFFDGESIVSLKGKISKVYMNGIPISSEKNELIKIRSESEIKYQEIAFREDVFIEKADYRTQGYLNVKDNENILFIDNEKLYIENYFGKLLIENNRMNINGLVQRIKITGESGVVSIGKNLS